MARKPSLAGDDLARLDARIRTGDSTRNIAREFGVSAQLVSRRARELRGEDPRSPAEIERGDKVARRAGALADRYAHLRAPAAPVEEPPAPTVEGPSAEESPAAARSLTGLLDELWTILRTIKTTAAEAKRAGNYTAAARMSRDAVQLAPTIARLEKLLAIDGGGIRVTPEELERARGVVRSRIAAIASRGPIRCASCARELAIDLAGAREKCEEGDRVRPHGK